MGVWWLRVQSLGDAIAALPDRVISAGGTLIKPAIAKDGSTGEFVDVSGLRAMAEIVRTDHALTIGALVRNQTLIDHPDVKQCAPALAHAAMTIGNPHVRRAGTIGGNVACRLARASTPPALLVYDARLRLAERDGEREVALAPILTDGVPAGSLITAVIVPRSAGFHVAFDKLAWRNATAKAIVTAAIAVRLEDGVCSEVRLAAGGLCVARRLPRAEARLRGRALDAATIEAAAAIAAAEPPWEVTDVPAGETYRRRVIGQTIARLLAEVPRG
ncbi:MAG TPA: FAD binding domain-containing protein [Kofleriaceae bacterium]|nr:FAD binding domain-containing protein [Kofleriaceae bacterium]